MCDLCSGIECQQSNRQSCDNDVCSIRVVLVDGQTTPEYDYGCLPQLSSKTLCNSTRRDDIHRFTSRYNCCTDADFCNRELTVSLPSTLVPSVEPTAAITTTNASAIGNTTQSTTHAPRVSEWEIAMYTAVTVGSIIILILVITLFLELIYCRHKIWNSRSGTQQLQLSESLTSTHESNFPAGEKDHENILYA